MPGMREIIQEAESLPVEERVMVIDSLLQTLNPPLAGVDLEWAQTAKRRLAELRSGHQEAIPGDAVFDRIRKRFEK